MLGHAETPVIEVIDCAEAHAPSAHAFGPALRAASTLVAYVDATAHAGALAFALFDELGGGGGAGSLDFVRRPVIVTPQGLRDGVAVVAGLSCRAAVGVTHGWDHLCARRVRRGQGARASELGGSEHGLFVAVRHPHRGVGLHVARTAKPPIGGGGALTIGELASSQGAFVRVHNKTTVLALLSAPTAG